jgi:transcription termination/antitermination protein NusG
MADNNNTNIIAHDPSDDLIEPLVDDGMGPVTTQDETIDEADIEEPQIYPAQEDKADLEKTEIGGINGEETEIPSEEEQVDQILDTEEQASKGETVEQIVADEAETGSTSEEEISTENQATDIVEEVADKPAGRWYVVHTFAGHENKVATALRQRIEAEHLEHKIFEILVPTQDKIEIRGGKKEQVKEKIFPGYILVNMDLDDISWLAVRTTPGVTSFVGINNKPTPISDREVSGIVKFMTQGAPATFKDVFMVDDTVKIIDGPFAEFIGKVDSVDKEKGRVRVLVSIFGRETPVELDFLQVQKL